MESNSFHDFGKNIDGFGMSCVYRFPCQFLKLIAPGGVASKKVLRCVELVFVPIINHRVGMDELIADKLDRQQATDQIFRDEIGCKPNGLIVAPSMVFEIDVGFLKNFLCPLIKPVRNLS